MPATTRTDTLTHRDVELLRDKVFVHFTTLMEDGSPQTTPVWADVDQEQGLVLINTQEGRIKLENVRRDPRVAMSVTAADDPYRALWIRGRVVEILHEGAAKHIDALATKYTGVERYGDHRPDFPRVILKVRPDRIGRMGS